MLSIQAGINIDVSHNEPMCFFHGQMAHYETINLLPENTLNHMHPLSMMASKANNDVLCYHQAMKAEDADDFKETMGKEIQSFKDEETYELIHVKRKPSHESLIPFIWSFKRKRSPMGELMKHKARSCAHGGKQIKGVDFLNTHDPVAQSTTVRIMLVLHQMKGWDCRHLDCVLAFAQAPTDADACLKVPAGFHVEDSEGDDVSDEHCLKLRKNCHGTRDAASN